MKELFGLPGISTMIFSIFLFQFIVERSSAQSFTKDQIEEILNQAKFTVEQYTNIVNLLGDINEPLNDRRQSYRPTFIRLFFSDHSLMFNDLDPEGKTSGEFTPQNYADNLLLWYNSTGLKSVISLDNLSYGTVKQQDAQHYIDVNVVKKLQGSYMNRIQNRNSFQLVFRITFRFIKGVFSDFRIIGIIKNSDAMTSDTNRPQITGSIVLNVPLSGKLMIDNKYIQDVTENTIVQVAELSAGDHTIEINGDEYWKKNITIVDEKPLEIGRKSATAKTRDPNLETADFNQTSGIFSDARDGKKYKWIKIGNQVWMAENLNIGSRIIKSEKQTNNEKVEKYCYENNESNCDIYGGLYQWDEMMQYTTSAGSQGICPTGWHIPTEGEWGLLIKACGDWNVAGQTLKQPNGFHAVMGGSCLKLTGFFNIGREGNYWTSDLISSRAGWNITLSPEESKVSEAANLRSTSFSVRCIKN